MPRPPPLLSNLDIDDEDYVDYDIALHRGYGRPKLVQEEEILSDYVRTRLFLARMKALEKFKEIHSEA